MEKKVLDRAVDVVDRWCAAHKLTRDSTREGEYTWKFGTYKGTVFITPSQSLLSSNFGTARQSLGESTLKEFGTFRDSVKATAAQLNPAIRSTPDSIRMTVSAETDSESLIEFLVLVYVVLVKAQQLRVT